MKSAFVFGAALIATLASAGCENATPTTPTPTTSPFAVRLGGQWTGALTLSGVTGGECVGADLSAQNAVNKIVDQGTVTITQDRSSVEAVVRSSTTGLSCTYEGDASLASFALSSASCDVETIIVQCSNGAARVLELVGSTMTATINGNTANGTVATHYNVFSESTEAQQRKPVAGLEVRQQFTAVRQ